MSNPISDLDRPRQRILSNFIDQTEPQCLGRRKSSGRKEHLKCPAFADQPRQSLCSAPTGDDPKSGSGMRKKGIGRCEAFPACQRKIESAAEAVTVDRRDGENARACDTVHYRLSATREILCRRGVDSRDLPKVRAGGKDPVRPGKYYRRAAIFQVFKDPFDTVKYFG